MFLLSDPGAEDAKHDLSRNAHLRPSCATPPSLTRPHPANHHPLAATLWPWPIRRCAPVAMSTPIPVIREWHEWAHRTTLRGLSGELTTTPRSTPASRLPFSVARLHYPAPCRPGGVVLPVPN